MTFAPTPLGEHDVQQVRDLLAREFHERCRPTHAPACAIFTVEVEEGQVLHAAFDHITFDGLSAYAGVGAIASLHTAILSGVHQEQTSPSYVDSTALEVAVGQATPSDDPRLDVWRTFLGDGRIPGAPAESGIDPDTRYGHHLLRHEICGGDLAAQLDLCYATEGIPTGMLWTAILMQAIGDDPHVLMSTHGRASALWIESIGWFGGVAPLSISLPAEAGTRDWVVEANRVWRQVAPAAALPLGLVQRLVGVPVEPQIVLSIIDGSRVAGHEWWHTLGSGIQLGDVPDSSQTHMWLTILPEGVTLVTRLPEAPGARAWLDDVAARFTRLVELEASAPLSALQEAHA